MEKIELEKNEIETLKNYLKKSKNSKIKKILERLERPKIEIVGYRWFQKTYGNTYHAVKIFLNGEMIFKSSEYVYGYSDQYIQTAHEKLKELKIVPENSEYWKFLRSEENFQVEYSARDLDKKTDFLKCFKY
jgi:hypothetical protein